jgi:hypothetical protein
VDCFYFIRQIIVLERKVGKNECQPVVVWPKHDGTLEAQPASEWKEAIDARKINISELKSMPITPPD